MYTAKQTNGSKFLDVHGHSMRQADCHNSVAMPTTELTATKYSVHTKHTSQTLRGRLVRTTRFGFCESWMLGQARHSPLKEDPGVCSSICVTCWLLLL